MVGEQAWVYFLKARQLGKSTIACAYDGWVARFGPPNARVHIFCQRDQNTVELLEDVAYGLELLPDFLRLPLAATAHSLTLNAVSRTSAPSARTRPTADGQSLRALAPDYAVAHTTLSRHFARPQVAKELKRVARGLPAERRAAAARLRAEQWAEREAREQQAWARPASAHPPRPGRIIRPRGGFNW